MYKFQLRLLSVIVLLSLSRYVVDAKDWTYNLKGKIEYGGWQFDKAQNNRFYRAFRDGKLNEVKALIDKHNVDRPIFDPMILLYPEITKARIANRPKGIKKEQVYAVTPLGWACKFNRYRAAKYLIDLGADIERCWYTPQNDSSIGFRRGTPMRIAVAEDHLAIVMLLMRRGYEFDPGSEKAKRLFTLGVWSGSHKVWKYLKSKGVRVSGKYVSGSIFQAHRNRNWPAIDSYLEACNNIKDSEIWNGALISAAKQKENGYIERLIKAGASPNCLDHKGRPVLYVALYAGNLEGARSLVKLGANVQSIKDVSELQSKRALMRALNGVSLATLIKELRRLQADSQ